MRRRSQAARERDEAIAGVFTTLDLCCAIAESVGMRSFRSFSATNKTLAEAVRQVLEMWAVLKLKESAEVYQRGVVRSLCALPDHNIAIGDTYNHRMQIHNPQLSGRDDHFNAMPRLWKKVFYPQGLVSDGENIYVCTASSLTEGTGNPHRVLKFRLKDGVEVAASPEYFLRFPHGLALGDQHLFVGANDLEDQHWQNPGRKIYAVSKESLMPCFSFTPGAGFVPASLLFHEGVLFAADQACHVIVCFSGADGDSGTSFSFFGGHGTAPGKFNAPSGLAITRGHLIVGEESRVQVLTLDGQPRQIIKVPGSQDLSAICVGMGSFVYVADSLGERSIITFEVVGAAANEGRAIASKAKWGCGEITGIPRHEREEQIAAQFRQGELECCIQ